VNKPAPINGGESQSAIQVQGRPLLSGYGRKKKSKKEVHRQFISEREKTKAESPERSIKMKAKSYPSKARTTELKGEGSSRGRPRRAFERKQKKTHSAEVLVIQPPYRRASNKGGKPLEMPTIKQNQHVIANSLHSSQTLLMIRSQRRSS